MGVTAIVPLKALDAAKGRLGVALDGHARRELVAKMLALVVDACRGCAAVDELLLVAGDEAAADLGRSLGVRALVVTQPGLPAAMAAADDATSTAAATLVVAADLPAATAVDLDAVCGAARGGAPAVVVAPTLDGGTGALLRRPPRVIQTAYGPGSAAAHLALARAAGVRAVRLDVANLAHDVDTPEQLRSPLACRIAPGVGSHPG